MGDRQQLWQYFSAIDTDRSGHLSVFELQRALQLGNLNFSLKAVQALMRLHDPDGNGHIDFNEFERLHHFLMGVIAAFHAYDADRSGAHAGNLDRREVLPALQRAGYRLDPPAFEALYRLFDPDRTNSLCLSEFIALTCFLQAATKTFQAFDSQRTGRITLDFSQFVYAAAHCG